MPPDPASVNAPRRYGLPSRPPTSPSSDPDPRLDAFRIWLDALDRKDHAAAALAEGRLRRLGVEVFPCVLRVEGGGQ